MRNINRIEFLNNAVTVAVVHPQEGTSFKCYLDDKDVWRMQKTRNEVSSELSLELDHAFTGKPKKGPQVQTNPFVLANHVAHHMGWLENHPDHIGATDGFEGFGKSVHALNAL